MKIKNKTQEEVERSISIDRREKLSPVNDWENLGSLSMAIETKQQHTHKK
jgi:hypothetical protein